MPRPDPTRPQPLPRVAAVLRSDDVHRHRCGCDELAIRRDDEHPAGGDDGEPLGSVPVQHETCGAVEQPAPCVAVGGHPVVDRRPGQGRIEPVAGQRRVLRQRRQERRRIGELDGVLLVGQLRPAGFQVGLPERRGVLPTLGDPPHQRRRALLAHRVAYRLLP